MRSKISGRAGLLLRLSFAALALFSMAVSCASDKSKNRTGVKIPPAQAAPEFCCVKSVAVLNFFERGANNADPERPYTCRLTNLNFTCGEVAEGSGEVVADQFRYHMSEQGYRVAEREATLAAVSKAQEKEASEYSAALGASVGRALGVDAVVMGSVMRFEERVGGKWAVDKPASVAFSVAVVSSIDGSILWKAKFEKTQKALFDDVLDYKTFFKGGMVWQTADKLSEIGVLNILGQIPFQQIRQGAKK